jgi:Phage integrase family
MKRDAWVKRVGRAAQSSDPVFPSAEGRFARPRSATFLRDDLKAAGCSTTSAGFPIDFHATRRSFSTWLDANGVSGELIDRMMGHSGRTVRQRHYSAADFLAMRRALETITLDLSPKEPHAGLSLMPPGLPANDQRPRASRGFPAVRGKTAGKRLLRSPTSTKKNSNLAPVAQWIEQRFPNRKKRYL